MKKSFILAGSIVFGLFLANTSNAQCGLPGTPPCPSTTKPAPSKLPVRKADPPAKPASVSAAPKSAPAKKNSGSSATAQAKILYNKSFENCENPDCSIEYLNQAIKLNPKFAAAYGARGYFYSSKQLYDEAINDFDRAIELNPQDPAEYINYRASAYFTLNKFDEAISDYNKLIKIEPNDIGYYVRRIQAYRKSGIVNSTVEADERKIEELEIAALRKKHKIVPESEVINQKALFLAQPDYAAYAKLNLTSREVRLVVLIHENGLPSYDVIVVKGDDSLHYAAIQAARASKFVPLNINGKPVKYVGVIVYNFVT